MSRFIRPVLGVALGAMAFAVLAAQQTAKDESKPKPELAFIVQEIVKPSMAKEYEAATRQLIHEFEQYKIDPEKVSWHTVAGAEMGYVYVMPIKDFAGMETLHENWMNAIETIGADRFESFDARISQCMDSRSAFHAVRLTDLCYEAAKPACPPDEVNFLHYEFFYVLPGKEKQFEGIAAKFKDLYTKHNVAQSWSFYKKITGDDLPLYVVIEGARNETEHRQLTDRIFTSLAEDTDKLFDEVMSCIRRMEKKTATPRADLSYPNPKTATH